MSEAAVAPPRRLAALDGLRGIAIVLVVLSHGWVLWPMDFIDNNTWIRPFFRSGNSAVTVFLVASGFLSYRALAAPHGLPRMQPVIAVVRRVVRVAPTLYAMLAVLLMIAAVDNTDTTSKNINRASIWHATTYTYNWMVQADFLQTRADLGHLWYLSVDMQAFLLFALVAFVLRRRTVGLIITLVCWFLLLVWWRFHAFDTESIWVVLNRTSARMDAFVIGALAAAVATHLPRQHPAYRWLAPATLIAMVPTLFWCDTDPGFMGWGGTVLELLVAVHIVAATSLPPSTWQLCSNPVLVRLGAMSLALYIWHFPIFHFMQRHSDWAWGWQVVVALAATWIIARLCESRIDVPVTRFLAHPAWSQARSEGLVPYAKARAISRWQTSTENGLVGRLGRRGARTTRVKDRVG